MTPLERDKLDKLYCLLIDYQAAQGAIGQGDADALWKVFQETLEDFLWVLLLREPTAEDYEHLDLE